MPVPGIWGHIGEVSAHAQNAKHEELSEKYEVRCSEL